MTNNKQQTAVELFAERTFNLIELMKRKWVNQEKFLDGMLKARNEAKEMEKEQMKGMYVEGSFAKMRYYDGLEYIDADQYYNETYGGNK
jgi:hypothetical protein